MCKYTDLKAKHAKQIEDFPICFAFSAKQMERAIEKLGPKDTLVSIVAGGIVRKSDCKAFDKLFSDIEEEKAKAIKDDSFLLAALVYELGNHEYSYTLDPTDAIEALALDIEDERVRAILGEAKRMSLALAID